MGFSPVTRAALAALRPLPSPGVRPEAPDDLHLTLHFLGPRALDPVVRALATVHAAPFELRLGAPGHFAGRGGDILWAGVDGGEPLRALHLAVAGALVAVGFQPEARPWTPHVTLARTRGAGHGAAIASFLDQPAPDGVELVQAFGLYTSGARAGEVRYERVAHVPLAG